MRHGLLSLVAVLAALVGGYGAGQYRARHPQPAQPIAGRVEPRDRASLFVSGPKTPLMPTGAGWRAAWDVPAHDDLVLTPRSGHQQTWDGAGRHPCARGCVVEYEDAILAASNADAGPGPDVGGDEALAGIARCVTACETRCDVVWPPPGGAP